MICTKCTKDKASNDFYKRSKAAGGGHMSECKLCFNDRPRNRSRERDNLRTWRVQNPEKVKAQAARRRLNNPDSVRAAQLAYRSKVAFGPVDIEYIAILRQDPCAYCEAACEHIDHIVPVKNEGSSEWNNLTASCSHCNQTKTDKPLLTFLLDR